jgi:hypothetical protein
VVAIAPTTFAIRCLICLKSCYLPADGAMSQPELGSRFGIAARPGGNLEDAQGIEWWEAMHRTREENEQCP